MNKDSLPDFSNMVLSIRLIDDSHSHDLFNSHFEMQGGRLFLVGTIPEIATESGWNGNQTGAVAWDRVQDYCTFPDMDTYVKAVNKSESIKDNENGKDI